MIGLLPERAGETAPLDLQQKRAMLAEAVRLGALPRPGPVSEETIAGVRVLRFGKREARGSTVVHCHGGGYRQGQPEMIGAYAAALAIAADVEVVCPAYRLAPENPFPAGLNDTVRLISALRAEMDGRLIIAGDSAGGGIAAAATLRCIGEGMTIAGVVLHSPWLDLTVSSPTYQANSDTDPLFSLAFATEAARLYLQGHPPRDHLASALFGDLENYPPTFISAGEGEVLLGDAVSFADELTDAGCDVELCLVPEMEHVAVTRSLDLSGARDVMNRTIAFVTRHL